MNSQHSRRAEPLRLIVPFAVLSAALAVAVVFIITRDPYDGYATGRVTKLEATRPGELPADPIAQSKDAYVAHIAFTTGAGQQVAIVHDRTKEGWRDFAEGESVSVNYDTSDPQRYKLARPDERRRFAWQAAAVWLVLNVLMAMGFRRAAPSTPGPR